MTRRRASCRYCGAVIDPYGNGPGRPPSRACKYHAYLLAREPVDNLPPDPAYSLPTMHEQAAREREDSEAPKGKATR